MDQEHSTSTNDVLGIIVYEELANFSTVIMLADEYGRHVRTHVPHQVLEATANPKDVWRTALEQLCYKWHDLHGGRYEVVEPTEEGVAWLVRRVQGGIIEGEIVEEGRAIGA